MIKKRGNPSKASLVHRLIPGNKTGEVECDSQAWHMYFTDDDSMVNCPRCLRMMEND